MNRFALISACVILTSSLAEGQTREEAVLFAREGRVDEGIAALRKLLADHPNDTSTAYDLAVLLTWQGRSREAIEVFEKIEGVGIPEYVLAPMARAYRDQKRFEDAESLILQGLQRFPTDPLWPTLAALLLVDQDKPAEAVEILRKWTEKKPDDAEVWLALGYAYQKLRDKFGVLRAYGQALRLDPGNEEARRSMAGVLSLLGAPYAAASLLGKDTPLSVKAHEAGLLVRWGARVLPLDPRRRFEGTDAALHRIDVLLARADEDSAVALRLRKDRIVALRDREYWSETIMETQRLRTAGIQIPSYVRQAEADALLALRRPREAQVAYEEALEHGIADPDKEREARIGRFFALVEQEKFRDAFQTIDALAGSVSPRSRMPEQQVTYPNWAWLDGMALATEARFFAEMPASAWQRLRPLVEGAPANADLPRLRGDIAASREWPRFSDDEIHIAASLEPEDKGIQVALAESAMRRKRWGEARQRIAELTDLYPADNSVRRLKVDLKAHDSWEIFSDFNFHYEPSGSESESGGTAPGTGYDTSTLLYSPPIHEYWRLVLGFEVHEAQVEEGNAQRFREGLGFDFTLGDFSLEGMFCIIMVRWRGLVEASRQAGRRPTTGLSDLRGKFLRPTHR